MRAAAVPAPPENFAPLQIVTIGAGDRLDNLAARYIGDPQQFWRLCDANGAMQPKRWSPRRIALDHHLARRCPESVMANSFAKGIQRR